MGEKHAIVVLVMTYDDEEYSHPSTWDWTTLLDLTGVTITVLEEPKDEKTS